MIAGAVLSWLLAAGSAAVADRSQLPDLPVGIFGNIHGSDDVEGLEIRVFGGKGGNFADFAFAEGGCGEIVRGSLRPDGSRWLFEFAGPVGNGEATAKTTIRFWLSKAGRNIRVDASEETEWIAGATRTTVLPSVRRPRCMP